MPTALARSVTGNHRIVASTIPVARVVNISRALEELKEAGLWIAAADVSGDRSVDQCNLDGPLAVVIGAEGEGIREGVLNHCDFRLVIPLQGQVASLNASVSAGILLYEVSRQRRAPKAPSRQIPSA